MGGQRWWGWEHAPCFLVGEDIGAGLLPWRGGLGAGGTRLEASGRAAFSWCPPDAVMLCLCCCGCWFLGSVDPTLGFLSQKCDESEQRTVPALLIHQPTEGTGRSGGDPQGPALCEGPTGVVA